MKDPATPTPTLASTPSWATRQAPSLDEMTELAEAAFAALPETFRALCEGVVLQVAEFPDDDVIEEMELESEFDLLGLFQGFGLAQDGAVAPTGRLPNMIFLYRRPIIDYWASHEETLGHIITHVLVHEIGHQLGLSDDDMEAIERSAG